MKTAGPALCHSCLCHSQPCIDWFIPCCLHQCCPVSSCVSPRLLPSSVPHPTHLPCLLLPVPAASTLFQFLNYARTLGAVRLAAQPPADAAEADPSDAAMAGVEEDGEGEQQKEKGSKSAKPPSRLRWGRRARAAFSAWYLARDPMDLAYQVCTAAAVPVYMYMCWVNWCRHCGKMLICCVCIAEASKDGCLLLTVVLAAVCECV